MMDREKKNSGFAGVMRNLLKHLWVILIFAAIGGMATYFITTQYIDARYHASVKLYINSEDTADNLVDVCGAVVKSQPVLEEIIGESGLTYTHKQLNKMISYADVNDTNMIEITVKSVDAAEAERIANVIAYILPEMAEDVIFNSRVTVLQYASLPTEPSEPNVGRNTLIGLVTGVALAVIFITLVYVLDDAIKDKEYLARTFNIPVLAYIPDYTRAEKDAEEAQAEDVNTDEEGE